MCIRDSPAADGGNLTGPRVRCYRGPCLCPLSQGAWRLWLGLRHGEPHANVPITNVRAAQSRLNLEDERANFDHSSQGCYDALHYWSSGGRWVQRRRVLTFWPRSARDGRRSSQLHRGIAIARSRCSTVTCSRGDYARVRRRSVSNLKRGCDGSHATHAWYRICLWCHKPV